MEKRKNNALAKNIFIILSIFIALLVFTALLLPCAAQETIKPKGMSQQAPRQPQAAEEKPKPPEEPLVPLGKEADITVFFTGDAIGYIEECG